MSPGADGGAAVPVTFISPSDAIGGAEHSLLELLEQLGPTWVDGIVCLADGAARRRFQAAGHPVAVIPTSARLGILTSAVRLRRVLVRHGSTVVHANGVKSALVAVLATAGLHLPVIWVKRDFSWDGPLARFIGRRCHVVVGVSNALVEVFRGSRVNVRVVPNGVPAYDLDRAASRAALLQAIGAAPDAEVIVQVGRLEPGKGQLDLLEQAPALLARRPLVRLVFVGAATEFHPGYAETLEERTRSLGVEAAVTMLGSRSDAIALMAGADAVAVPSRPYSGPGTGEGFGRVAAEAMAVGTPVVAYAEGGLPEVIGDSGRLVEPGDGAALGAALADLLDDRDTWEAMSAAGREQVKRFPVDAVVASMREVYRDAAAAGPTAAAHPSSA